jgi:hypothetical protein
VAPRDIGRCRSEQRANSEQYREQLGKRVQVLYCVLVSGDDRLQSLRHCDPPFPVGWNSKLAAGSRLSFYITFSPEGVPGDVAAACLRALVFAQVPATARGPGTRWS